MTITDPTATTAAVAFDAAELKAALTKLKPVIPSGKWSNRTLQAVNVEFDGEYATLTATDLDNTLSVRLVAPALDSGSFLVPFPRLAKVLSAYGKGTVAIHSEGTTPEPTTVIRFERSTVRTTVPVDPFPKTPTVGGRRVNLFPRAIADVLPAISKDDARPILCSVLIEAGRYVATDSYRIHMADTHIDSGEAFMLSRSTAEMLAKMSNGMLAARVNDRFMRVEIDPNTTLTARLVDGSFPAYRSLIPDTDNVVVEFGATFPIDLKRLMKLGTVTAGSALDVAPSTSGGVEVSVTDDDDVDSFICDGQMTLDRIAWNPHYLLPLIDGMSNLRFFGTDHLKPTMLRDDAPHITEGCTRTRLIMPVRKR